MKHGNIAIFIPHNGCPHQCSFCNQREITGQTYQPTALDVKNTLEKALADLGDTAVNYEIAFFGGSFTAIDREYMLSLLDAAKPYTEYFSGIRLSTRPDYIDDEILVLLKKYSVKTIELGAQSMDDCVLAANSRGHSSEDVVNSSGLIKSYGFKLGLQMMTGLFMSDVEKDIDTARRFIDLRPDCVRIYPTVIMRGTDLCRYYSEGVYKPYSLEESVELVAKLLLMFYDENIDVIRVGLHYSDSLADNDIARNYHPAFKELCENRIFFKKILEKLDSEGKKEIDIIVNPSSLSKAIGQKKSNLLYLEKNGYKVHYIKDSSLGKYDIEVKKHR